MPKIDDLKVFNDFKVKGARAYSPVGRSRLDAYGVSGLNGYAVSMFLVSVFLAVLFLGFCGCAGLFL